MGRPCTFVGYNLVLLIFATGNTLLHVASIRSCGSLSPLTEPQSRLSEKCLDAVGQGPLHLIDNSHWEAYEIDKASSFSTTVNEQRAGVYRPAALIRSAAYAD